MARHAGLPAMQLMQQRRARPQGSAIQARRQLLVQALPPILHRHGRQRRVRHSGCGQVKNRLYRADCKPIIDSLIAEGIKVDLIYLDPPFNSNRTYSMLFHHKPEHVRELIGTMRSEDATIGVLIVDIEPTDKMEEAAKKAKTFRYQQRLDMPPKQYDRVQIITAHEVIEGAKVDLPPSMHTVTQFRKAQMEMKV